MKSYAVVLYMVSNKSLLYFPNIKSCIPSSKRLLLLLKSVPLPLSVLLSISSTPSTSPRPAPFSHKTRNALHTRNCFASQRIQYLCLQQLKPLLPFTLLPYCSVFFGTIPFTLLARRQRALYTHCPSQSGHVHSPHATQNLFSVK